MVKREIRLGSSELVGWLQMVGWSVQALGCLMVVVGILVAVGFSMRLHPGPAWRGVSPELRVLNFNIQQGFSRSGSVNYDSIYNMLDAERPHVSTFVTSPLLSRSELFVLAFLALQNYLVSEFY